MSESTNFLMSGSAILACKDDIITEFNRSHDLIASRVGSATFDNTFRTLSFADGDAATRSVQCVLPALVSTDPDARKAASASKAALKDMWDARWLRQDVYSALVECKTAIESGKAPAVAGEDARLMARVLAEFERNGKDYGVRAQVKELRKSITDLTSAFETNLNESVTTVPFTREQLKGVSESFISRLPTSDDGKYLVSLKAPDRMTVMKHAVLPETRRAMHLASLLQCRESNGPLLTDFVKQRARCAKVLGYPSHAHLALQNKMAKTPEAVMTFLLDISARMEPRLTAEHAQLLGLKANELRENGEHVNTEELKLNAWDVAYYEERLKAKEYSLDEEEVKKYFPLDVVLANTLRCYERTLSLQFEKVAAPEAWHEDVVKYEVRTPGADGSAVGYFYLDLHPRDGKYSHQCVFPVLPGYRRQDGTYQLPVAAIIGNLARPTADAPALLRHYECETFFHEFGHVMHCLCTRAEHTLFSWAWSAVPWPGGVEMDFLEAPSQMLENWLYDKEVLTCLSGHFTDHSKKLPDELLAALVAVRNLGAGYRYQRQIAYSVFDMVIHTQDPPYTVPGVPGEAHDIQSLWPLLMRRFGLPPIPEGTNPATSFYHVAMGYDAAYYGYLWSEVYSADMFEAFATRGGCFDAEVGARYRDEILRPGATRDGADMLRAFLGRDPSPAPFLAELGLDA